MASASRRRSARGLGAATIALAAAVGLVAPAGAAHSLPHLRRVHVSTRHVHPGGTFTITAVARYRTPEEFAVAFYFDPTKVDLPDETCAQGYPPQPADNPTCEYDNRFGTTTTTVGYFRVAPNATGRTTVTVCTETVSFGGGPDSPGDRCVVRKFHIS